MNKKNDANLDPKGLAGLGIVYIVWSSTYLAIRIGVNPDGGFSPFTLGMLRTITSSVILLIWAIAAKKRIRPTKAEWITLIASGLLLWIGGNGLVMVGERKADSGLAALIVATTPLWTAFFETILDRKIPRLLLVGSLLVGFCGIVVLTLPVLLVGGTKGDPLSLLVIALGAMFWSMGTLISSRRPVELSTQVTSGMQMLIASAGFAVMGLIFGESFSLHVSTQAWLAWGYLAIFGGVLAFTAFLTAVKLLPTDLVMTYAYINPVLAVALGWLVLREQITIWTILGSVLVLLGVLGVFQSRKRQSKLLN